MDQTIFMSLLSTAITVMAVSLSRYLSYLENSKTAKVARSTHCLVNSAMDAQMKINKLALRRIADLTKDPVDVEAALEAENVYLNRQENRVEEMNHMR